MDLAALKRREYALSGYLTAAGIALQLALLCLSIISSTSPGTVSNAVLGAAAFLGPFAGLVLREWARNRYGLGEKIRRLLFLKDGLGRQPSALDLLDIGDRRTVIPAPDPLPFKSDFSSSYRSGPQRLAHITQESAFHTRSLAGTAALTTAILTGCCALGILLLLVMQTSVGHPHQEAMDAGADTYGRMVSTLLVFFLTGLFADRLLSFRALYAGAAAVMTACDTLHRSDAKLEDVLLTLAAYDTALATAPVIPTWLYLTRRKTLQTAWEAANMAPAPPPPPQQAGGAKS